MAAFFLIIGLSSNVDSNAVGKAQRPASSSEATCYRKVVAGTRRQCTQVKNRDPAAKPDRKTHTECKDLPYYREEAVPCKNG
ncbi:MAG: hypothetical protein ABL958_03980 [Bdellovibrionia bacterium]